MSWTKDITIWCDHEGCAPEWVMNDALARGTVKNARRHAARIGWVHIDGKDYCPNHAKEPK